MSFLLIFPDAGHGEAGWALAEPGGVLAHGLGLGDLPPEAAAAAIVIAAPGDRVGLHWLDLPAELSAAQAEAAARLALGGSLLQPGEAPHLAVGRVEEGQRCIGIAAPDDVRNWLDVLAPYGLVADHIIPEPFLLLPPLAGYRSREAESLRCYRGRADAFAAEEPLARLILGDAEVEPVTDAQFEAELHEAILRAPLDLRQGRFARRRVWRNVWRVDVGTGGGFGRRIAAFALALLCATVAVGVADLFRHAHAAGRLEREARAFAPRAGAAPVPVSPAAGFGPMSASLFDAIRATPNVELATMEFRPGALTLTVRADSAASAEALRERIAASGYAAQLGPPRPSDGAVLVALDVRPK